MITLYGIANCDTVKKAIARLKKSKIDFQFHDYKTRGISEEKLQEWLALKPVDIILNKKSVAWRELSAAQQKKSQTTEGAVSLMKEYNNLIKRPVLEIPGTILIGFNENNYKKIPR